MHWMEMTPEELKAYVAGFGEKVFAQRNSSKAFTVNERPSKSFRMFRIL